MKSHLLEYLDQHRRLEESVAPKKNEKSDVKSRLQVLLMFFLIPIFILSSSAGVCAAEEAEGKPLQPEPGGDGGGSRG